MKRFAAFLKATTLGGLFVVLPLIVVFGLLGKLFIGVHGVAETLMKKLTGQESVEAHFPIIFSILVVVGISFAFGLALISRRGKAAGTWFERTVLLRVPGYAAVRAIVGGLADASSEGAVKPGLLTQDPGIEAFVLVIEDHGNDYLTVFVPGSPNPASGNVQVVRKDLVRMLNVRMHEIGAVMQQWGMGSARVLAKHNAATPGNPHPSGDSVTGDNGGNRV
jgi:uncharacterized membrane protein